MNKKIILSLVFSILLFQPNNSFAQEIGDILDEVPDAATDAFLPANEENQEIIESELSVPEKNEESIDIQN